MIYLPELALTNLLGSALQAELILDLAALVKNAFCVLQRRSLAARGERGNLFG